MFGYNAVGGNISITGEEISGTSMWSAPGKGDVVVQNGNASYFIEVDDPSGGFVYIDGQSINIARNASGNMPFQMTLSPLDAGVIYQLLDSTNVSIFRIDADGTEHLAGSIGVNGVTPPGFPVLATGAGHTVDNVIALLQLCGLCKQS